MKFIWRYVLEKIKDISNEPYEDRPDVPHSLNKITSVRARDDFEGDSGLNMRVFKAIGGRIVSFSHYDRKTDRDYKSVYIITDEQNFERELGKIITMESMKG
jgi:spore maturation protein CgeB